MNDNIQDKSVNSFVGGNTWGCIPKKSKRVAYPYLPVIDSEMMIKDTEFWKFLDGWHSLGEKVGDVGGGTMVSGLFHVALIMFTKELKVSFTLDKYFLPEGMIAPYKLVFNAWWDIQLRGTI